MIHESFYKSFTIEDDKLGVYAGWVGIDGSFSDCMPVWNETHDACLIFSGENFTEGEVLSGLKTNGHGFEASNASYLIHLYEENGEGFFEQLNGWFAGLILDFRKGIVILFNDRIGMKRVYYYESKDAFYFSTEAKSLLKARPELRALNPESFGEYLNYGCVLNNHTLFPNVFLLPGGSTWTSEGDGVIKKCRYFRSESLEEIEVLNEEEHYEILKETFSRILPRYLSGNESVGMSLTGGLDTRMIMAWANAAPGKLPCYTFGGLYRDCHDVKVARQIADACQQSHRVIRVDSGFFSEFPSLAEKAVYITDGCLDVTGAAEIYVNRTAREIAPVRLTGNYGGEVMRGLVNFKPNQSIGRLLHHDYKSYFLDSDSIYKDVRKGHPISFAVFKQAPWHNYSRLSLEQSQLTLRSPFLDNDFVRLAYQAPSVAISSKGPSLRLISDGNPELRQIMTDRGVGGNAGYLRSKSTRLIRELTFKAEYAYDYGMPQWLAGIDFHLRPFQPDRLFLGRHKFCHFRIWYREELSGYVRSILTDDRTRKRPYWDQKRLEEIVRGHLTEGRNYTTEIHKLLTIELIHRIFVEMS
jgi:asparagine synthase (glutamine-hydrolysing)